MAITPQEFFSKNMKWIALGLFFLFTFKSIQSCNRDTLLSMDKKQYVHVIDSLTTKYNTYYKISQDSIKELNFELRMAKKSVESANDKANAVQSAVEKIKSNTTITVKGVEEVKDKKQ